MKMKSKEMTIRCMYYVQNIKFQSLYNIITWRLNLMNKNQNLLKVLQSRLEVEPQYPTRPLCGTSDRSSASLATCLHNQHETSVYKPVSFSPSPLSAHSQYKSHIATIHCHQFHCCYPWKTSGTETMAALQWLMHQALYLPLQLKRRH